MNYNETAKINKVTILCHGIISGIISAAYLLEVLKGSRTFLYFALIALLSLIPVVAEYMLYRKKPGSDIIRSFVACSYALLYAVAVFTTHSKLPFTYILPMLIVITLYGNIGYCAKVGVGAVLINVADVAWKAYTVGYAKEDIPDIEIRILVMIIIVIYLILTARVSNRINEEKQRELQDEKTKAERLLEQVMRFSGVLSDGVSQVDIHMSTLNKSVEEMSVAMEEVTTGTQETAESVQNQLTRTEEIQNLISDVEEVGVYIKESMDTASGEVQKGVVNMEALSSQSRQSREANAMVVEFMTALRTQAEKMNEITRLISSIANRTSMLALNASIEAARAGEAGSGFAVVAKQVSELSDQTKDATVNISELIGSVTGELNQMTDAVKLVEENSAAQDEKTEALRKSLQDIMGVTANIADRTKGLEKMIEKLAQANSDIVQNIQVISAITEEVTAHSSETLNTCRKNQDIVSEVSGITAKLNESAQDIKNVR